MLFRTGSTPTAPSVVWIPDEDVLACMSCAKAFSVLRRRHHCRRCGKVFCAHCCSSFVCFDAGSEYSGRVRVCLYCRSKALALPDVLLQYVQSFLGERDQCRMLRVCKRFQRLVILPFEKVPQAKPLTVRFRYHAERSLISCGDGWRIYSCTDQGTDQSSRGHFGPRLLKVVHKEALYSRRQWQDLQREINCLSLCSHPACPNLFEVLQTQLEVALVMEYFEGVRLSDVVARLGRVPERQAAYIAFHLVKAADYLHNRLRLAFRGFRCDNILIVSDGSAPLKLLDFSQCKVICRPKAMPEALQADASAPGVGKTLSALGESPISSPGMRSAPECLPASASPRSRAASMPPGSPLDDIGSPQGPGGARRRRMPLRTATDALWDGAQPSKMARTRKGGLRQPPPINVPGGRDEALLRRCAHHARAARAREANASFAEVVSRSFSNPTEERLIFGEGCLRVERPATEFEEPPLEHEIRLSPRRSAPLQAEPVYQMVQGPTTTTHGPRMARNITVRSLLSADILSIGVVLHKMLLGRDHVLDPVFPRECQFDDPEWEEVSDAAKLLVSTMLAADPAERPTVREALGFDWFRDGSQYEPCDSLVAALSPVTAPSPQSPPRGRGGRALPSLLRKPESSPG
eukprot:TRINITY_DN28170_c0_g1_i2.p1 TRINITY_DN28170_c0_g1~~TRINITY_DN28170_c0_g1_i2.p1  ORF type:complete len:658 (+),score=161.37 TRINITY_DN28170_c0_g1_i2:75-1976(+)